MKKTAYITQYGVGKITKDKGVDALYTDDLGPCLAVALVSDNVIQLLHVDTNVDITQIANTFKNFPTPYKLMIGYNKVDHENFFLLAKDSPMSKEGFIERLKIALNKLHLPLWTKYSFIPLITQSFGIGFDKLPFFNISNCIVIKEKDLEARKSVNFIYYVIDQEYDGAAILGLQHCAQCGLDLQYTDNGWLPMPKLNYFIQKLCWIFLQNKSSIKGYKSKALNDSEIIQLTSATPEILSCLNNTFDKVLEKHLTEILCYSEDQKEIVLKLNPLFIEHYKNDDYVEAKNIMDNILKHAHYLTDFSCLASTYFNAGNLALKLCDFENSKLYLLQSRQYSNVIKDNGKIKKIEDRILEINTLAAQHKLSSQSSQGTSSRCTTAFEASNKNLSDSASGRSEEQEYKMLQKK